MEKIRKLPPGGGLVQRSVWVIKTASFFFPRSDWFSICVHFMIWNANRILSFGLTSFISYIRISIIAMEKIVACLSFLHNFATSVPLSGPRTPSSLLFSTTLPVITFEDQKFTSKVCKKQRFLRISPISRLRCAHRDKLLALGNNKKAPPFL